MIGEIRGTTTPYFDKTKMRQSYKVRPALIIGQADHSDYVVLPVSTIPDPRNIDPVYDIPVDPAVYPGLNLKQKSYVRTHKQMVVHDANIDNKISDMKTSYQELYLEILTKMETFQSELLENAI